jgi:hypothetical protein
MTYRKEFTPKQMQEAKIENMWAATGYHVQDFAEAIREDFQERLAQAIEAMPFGDTSDSFAVFVRDFK